MSHYLRRLPLLFLLLFGVIIATGGCSAATEPAAPVPTAPPEPVALSPVEVTEAFYDWYLGLIGDRSTEDFTNPLAEGLYRNSEYLSSDFIIQVDEILADTSQGGYDPILLAQDIPVSFEVQEPAASENETTVVVLRYWGGNPEPSPMVVHLIREEGQWLIDNVTPFESPVTDAPAEPAQPATPATPDAVADAFYAWYREYIGDPSTEAFRNPLVDKAYRNAPYLSPDFVQHLDELLDGFRNEYGGIPYDPILCAQDVPTLMMPEVVFEREGTASVVMSSSFPNHRLAVDLRQKDGQWLISNITCAMEPDGIAKIFYTWYLGYIGDRSGESFRNPLVDKAYQEFPLLDEALVAEVDALLESFDQGGYDPFLLAQDIPQDFSVDPGVDDKTAVVHLQFGPGSVRHLLLTMNETGLRIRSIAEAEPQSTSGPVSEPVPADAGTLFTSDEYGFSFSYPAEWVLREMALGGPGQPEDWPVVAAWQLMPPDVADLLAANGPPDPTAPIIVAPFNVEVVVGDEAAMERVYYNFASGKKGVVAGYEATVLWDEPGYTQVVFAHPFRPGTWIVFSDWVTEFPGREEQAAVALPVWEPLLASLVFQE